MKGLRCIVSELATGLVLAGITALMPLTCSGEEPKALDLDNELVCRVNTEMISKRDIEDRMSPPGIASMLRAKKQEWERNKMCTPENMKQWYDAYIPPFRDALRGVVRERLMLQYAKNEKIAADDKEVEKEVANQMKRLKEAGLLGSKGFTSADVQKAIRDNQTIQTYQSKFYGIMEQPTRPEVSAYYKANLSRYQRKAGVMVRLIRVDRIVTNSLTNVRSVREDAYDRAVEIYQNVHDYGADFKEVARTKSDDLETRERGGLILPDAKDPNADPFFDLDSCNPKLSKAIRALKPGEVSGVFEYLQDSWAIAQVVDKREAGVEPLEGPLYDKIYKELLRTKSQRKEDEWFRKAVATNLIQRFENGVAIPMTVDFFFPDDVKPTTPAANANTQTPKDGKDGKEGDKGEKVGAQ